MNDCYKAANEYLSKRTGTYEFRCRRYQAVADKMVELGFNPGRLGEADVVMDLGAGRCEFGAYLRHRFPQETGKWAWRYWPMDAAIDGINLATHFPIGIRPTFFVAIEFLEHLDEWSIHWYLDAMANATRGAILTTPNPEKVDVLGMDATHMTSITKELLAQYGYSFGTVQLFTETEDTILAWRKGR